MFHAHIIVSVLYPRQALKFLISCHTLAILARTHEVVFVRPCSERHCYILYQQPRSYRHQSIHHLCKRKIKVLIMRLLEPFHMQRAFAYVPVPRGRHQRINFKILWLPEFPRPGNGACFSTNFKRHDPRFANCTSPLPANRWNHIKSMRRGRQTALSRLFSFKSPAISSMGHLEKVACLKFLGIS